MITGKKAMSVAVRLGVLDEFPRSAEAVSQVAEILCDLCDSDANAEWLVAEMLREFDKWPGPKTLRTVYRDQFSKKAAVWEPTYEKPELCPRCNGWGHVAGERKRVRCDCDAGVKLPENILAYHNRQEPVAPTGAKELPAGMTPITAADVLALTKKERVN